MSAGCGRPSRAPARGEFVRYEVELQGAGKTTAVVDFSLKPVLDFAGRVMLLIPEGRDISERKRAEGQMAEQIAELRRWHEATLGRELRVIEIKREVNRLLAQAGQPPRYTSVEGEEGPAKPSAGATVPAPR